MKRRAFFKQVIMVAIAAPMLALTGEQGIAEARTQTLTDQPLRDAGSTLFVYERDFMPMLDSVLRARFEGRIPNDVASGIVQSLLDVLLAAADTTTSSTSGALRAFIGEVKLHEGALPNSLARQLLERAQEYA